MQANASINSGQSQGHVEAFSATSSINSTSSSSHPQSCAQKKDCKSRECSPKITQRRHRCTSVCVNESMSSEYSETDSLLGSLRSVELQQSHNSDLTGSISSNASHCHDTSEISQIDKKAKQKLILASLLCLIFMIGEMVGGLVAHSLAIISDAAHLLTDFASFMISLLALYLANRKATKKLSFGWYRVEILGALISILMLWVLTGVLVYSAVNRIIDNSYTINAEVMLITAGCGVAFNIALGFTLHQSGHTHSHLGGGHSHGNHSHNNHPHGNHSHNNHPHDNHSLNNHSHSNDSQNNHNHADSEHDDHSHGAVNHHVRDLVAEEKRGRYGSINEEHESGNSKENGRSRQKGDSYIRFKDGNEDSNQDNNNKSNINVKAAFVHVVGDLCQSIGVLVAAFIIYFKPEWKMADPICTFLFSIFVMITTITILRDIIVVLMEGTPRHLVFGDIRDAFYNVDGVKDIHNLRVWSLTMNKTALSVHIAVSADTDPNEVLKTASAMIKSRFDIHETTMQIEEYVQEMLDCTKCQDLKD